MNTTTVKVANDDNNKECSRSRSPTSTIMTMAPTPTPPAVVSLTGSIHVGSFHDNDNNNNNNKSNSSNSLNRCVPDDGDNDDDDATLSVATQRSKCSTGMHQRPRRRNSNISRSSFSSCNTASTDTSRLRHRRERPLPIMPVATSPNTTYNVSEKQRQQNQQKGEVADDAENIDFFLLELELGEGAMRFAPNPCEPSIMKQVSNLTETQRDVVESLKSKWKYKCSKAGQATMEYPDSMILRFVRDTATTTSATTGSNDDKNYNGLKFHMNDAWKSMKKYNQRRYMNISCGRQMENQLLTKVRSQKY